MKTGAYITTGDVARLVGCPLHRVTYAFQRLRITEDARAGTYRLYRRERLPELVAALREIGSKASDTVPEECHHE